MRAALRSLRVRFAITAFVAIYVPVLVLLAVTLVVEQEVDLQRDGVVQVDDTVETTRPAPVVVAAALVLAPVAAALAWWLAGRAVRGVEAAVAVQGRLVEEASHELRTPLAVLTTNAQVLLDHPEPTIDLLRDGIERSGMVAGRMARAVDALLIDARSRARSITRIPTDLGALAAAVVAELGPAADAGEVSLDLVLARGSGDAPIDEPSVRRAVANLVTNAIEHSPRGATVTVEVIRPDDGIVGLTVSDQGPGVAPEDRDRIFDRFWTRRPGGAGLGLAVARQVAEAHGGTLTVVSPAADGRGARFVLHLGRGANAGRDGELR